MYKFVRKQLNEPLMNRNGDRQRRVMLTALIVQLGRDHGIPGYTTWRAHCGLGEVKSFKALEDDVQVS
jgi:hypothetical protein